MDITMLRTVLLRCFIYSLILIGISFSVYVFFGDFIYDIQGRIFSLAPEEINETFYSFLGFTKVFAFLVFLVPYIALTVTVKEKK